MANNRLIVLLCSLGLISIVQCKDIFYSSYQRDRLNAKRPYLRLNEVLTQTLHNDDVYENMKAMEMIYRQKETSDEFHISLLGAIQNITKIAKVETCTDDAMTVMTYLSDNTRASEPNSSERIDKIIRHYGVKLNELCEGSYAARLVAAYRNWDKKQRSILEQTLNKNLMAEYKRKRPNEESPPLKRSTCCWPDSVEVTIAESLKSLAKNDVDYINFKTAFDKVTRKKPWKTRESIFNHIFNRYIITPCKTFVKQAEQAVDHIGTLLMYSNQPNSAEFVKGQSLEIQLGTFNLHLCRNLIYRGHLDSYEMRNVFFANEDDDDN